MQYIMFNASTAASDVQHIDYKTIYSTESAKIEPGEIVYLVIQNSLKRVIYCVSPTKIKICKRNVLFILYTNDTTV